MTSLADYVPRPVLCHGNIHIVGARPPPDNSTEPRHTIVHTSAHLVHPANALAFSAAGQQLAVRSAYWLWRSVPLVGTAKTRLGQARHRTRTPLPYL